MKEGARYSFLPPMRARDGVLTQELVRTPGRFGLGAVPLTSQPDATTTAVCGFCSTGCGLRLHLKEGEAIGLTPETDYPVNLGMACPKGWEALTPLTAPDRAVRPMLRKARGDALEPVDWTIAASAFCGRFKAIKERHGGDALAFLSTGQICTEEMFFLGCLAKFGFGFAHGDGNTRQCMATAVTAYRECFGFDAPPATYRDFEESDVIVLVGSNLCIAHPIMWQRVLRNPHRPEIIVIDPRKTETAMAATQHYAIAPKSDLTLLYGIAHILIRDGLIDAEFVEQHTEGFDAFKRHVSRFAPAAAAECAGLSVDQVERLARTIGRGKRVSFWWTMGVNQGYEATRTAQAIIALALMTGSIGRPGTGANSITGQCNAMGSRLFSNTTSLVGGHDFANPDHRAKVARILEIGEEFIPEQNCLAYDQIIDGIDRGRIKGLWVIATNGSHSWIQQDEFNRILRKLDFLAVQDMFASTETALHADLILPAAGWGEKDGTFISSERRIGPVKKVARAPGEALADFSIFRLLGASWGCGNMFRRWDSPEAVFRLMTEVSRGQPCDISGITSYRMIDERGGIQWPFPAGSAPAGGSERRLFEDRMFYTPSGRAKFIFDDPAKNPDPTSDEFPLVLLTGRGTSAQWHTETRTAKSAVLRRLYPARSYIEIHPRDAERRGIEQGSMVRVRSRGGMIEVSAWITPTVGRGRVFIPMHGPETNKLTVAAFDPCSRQPNYKACAVSIEPAAAVR